MKKLCALVFTVSILFACGGNDDSSDTENLNPDTALLKSFKLTDDFGGVTTGTFQYNGNKISRIIYDGSSYEAFTYTGMLLTKVEYFEDSNLLEEQILTYDAQDRLISSTMHEYDPEFSGVSKTVYAYDTDGTISVQIYGGITETELELEETGTLIMENGNITRYTAVYADMETEVFNYEFDTKFNPLKNSVGYDVLNLTYLEGGVNNIKKYTISPDMEEYTTTFQYNSAGFPVKSIEDAGDGDTETIEYFYQ